MIRLFTVVISVMYLVSTSPILAGTWVDDFGDGNLDPWQLENPPMEGSVWNVENGECSGQYANAPAGICSALELRVENAATWGDYSVVCNVKLVENFGGGFFGIFFRAAPGWEVQKDYLAYVDLDAKKIAFRKDGIQKLSESPLPFNITEGIWYKLEVIAEGEHFEFYIDDDLTGSFDDNSYPSGTIWLTVRNAHAHFDDLVITGPEIPDGGPGFAVTYQNKLATMWGGVKRGK